MHSVTLTPGIPSKVLAKAHQLGVHNDCIVSEKPCLECSDNITLSFDFFYGHHTSEASLLAAIIDDFRSEEGDL